MDARPFAHVPMGRATAHVDAVLHPFAYADPHAVAFPFAHVDAFGLTNRNADRHQNHHRDNVPNVKRHAKLCANLVHGLARSALVVAVTGLDANLGSIGWRREIMYNEVGERILTFSAYYPKSTNSIKAMF